MLKPGAWLNHYQILGHLGTGGMGEVYRALDNKLQREVALKVLPKAFAQDPERLARFRREAQVLAQLNHVNIAAIYTVEQSGDTHFLVMELAHGDTLRDRIKGNQSRDRKGAVASSAEPPLADAKRHLGVVSGSDGGTGGIPLEEALDISKQIAAGLEHAHEKPIVHRDLKPANIKVTPEGVVKILDFGLARAFSGDTGSGDPADSPTLSAMTAPGTILGTAAYMSPEQARGKKVDKRADIWALGCVLYELLTGQQVFQSRDREGADTVQDILARVLAAEPDWTALPATTPPNVRVLLRRCLEKDAKRRLSSAADLQIQIDEAKAVPAATTPAPVSLRDHVSRRQALSLGLGALVLGAAIAALAVWSLRPAPPPQPVSRLVIPLPTDQQLSTGAGNLLALSPDGTRLAFIARSGGGTQQLFVRDLDAPEPRPIAGTENAFNPFFSPDGQWIGFFAAGKLKKVSVTGGAALTLSDAPLPRGATWGPNDTIVFTPTNTSGLFQVPAAGGAPQEFTTLKEGEASHNWPQFLPDGKAVLFGVRLSGRPPGELDIAVQPLDGNERRVLVRGGSFPSYAPTGHLVYYRAGTIMAVPFDPAGLEVRGTPAPVLEGVAAALAGIQFSFSNSGSLAYVPGGPLAAVEQSLVWVDRKGAEQPLGSPLRAYTTPRLSPDGRRVAAGMAGGGGDIWVYEIERRTLSRFTFDEETDETPAWTPDGRWLTFASDRDGTRKLLRKAADGSGEEEELFTVGEHAHTASWSADGKVLAYETGDGIRTGDIWLLPTEGDAPSNSALLPQGGTAPGQAGQGPKPIPLLRTPFNEGGARFSPDGRWLAYSSDESGRVEVYVQPYPGPGGKRQISPDGGGEPVWASNGRELFYRNGDAMVAVEITTQPTFSAGSPNILFAAPYARDITSMARYDVSPDGQRFLMLKAEAQEAAATQIHVVLNWFEELKRRVPVPR